MSGEHLLAVAACSGPRCRALRRLASGDDGTQLELRAAVAARPDAALISTGCLGACHLACVVAVGRAAFRDDGTLMWSGSPSVIGLAERDGRIATLAHWIGRAEHDGLPPALTALPRTA